ncbi:antichymotrypsin-2-like [Lingula anatina]|uniref:Antichymotrypsin-2-like n=1 Tax=Lingula anatina TaxID=7574 RepID=A0A1S3JNB4_LINAN|nr:antichymotrypsin-2-like [Lingula anatina]|eukprot:XP_013411850.1 antichymotrypsin-2-like [Lingula anatina]
MAVILLMAMMLPLLCKSAFTADVSDTIVDLSVKWFKNIVKSHKTGTFIFSPFHMMSSLASTMLCTSGDTRDEIARLLSINVSRDLSSNEVIEEVSKALQAYSRYFPDCISPKTMYIKSLARVPVFYERDYTFVEQLAEHYEFLNPQINTANYSRTDTDTSLQAFSALMNDFTRGESRNLFRGLNPSTSRPSDIPLVMANVVPSIGLKAAWKFNPNLTRYTNFFVNKNLKKEVSMMLEMPRSDNTVQYKDSRIYKAQAIKAPMDTGNARRPMDITIVLPDNAEGLVKASEWLPELLRGISWDHAHIRKLYVPEIDYSIVALDRLNAKHFGLNTLKLFREGAEMSVLGEESGNTWVFDLVHQSLFKLDDGRRNERVITSYKIYYLPEFKLNRPFFFFLTAYPRNIVFLGRVEDPEQIVSSGQTRTSQPEELELATTVGRSINEPAPAHSAEVVRTLSDLKVICIELLTWGFFFLI